MGAAWCIRVLSCVNTVALRAEQRSRLHPRRHSQTLHVSDYGHAPTHREGGRGGKASLFLDVLNYCICHADIPKSTIDHFG